MQKVVTFCHVLKRGLRLKSNMVIIMNLDGNVTLFYV